LGGEEKIGAYCHSLALKGGKRLAEILGTEVMHGKDDDEITLNMVRMISPDNIHPDEKALQVNVRLPIPPAIKYTQTIDQSLRDGLLNHWNTYAAHYSHNDKIWVRCSAQIWNEVSDFEYIGTALKAICAEIVQANKEL
jgi:hercynylcysteine S-oxide lyase